MQANNNSLSLRDLESISAVDLVNQITTYLTARPLGSSQARLAAETAVFWYARKRWDDYCSHDVRSTLHGQAVTSMLSVPLDRISAVTGCMNRNAHILQSLPTWLASNRFEEIIIIDYGSLEPLAQTLAHAGLLDHPSIRLIRVEAETWCLADAFNTGLYLAKAPFTIKLDADTLIRGTADLSLRLSAQQFKTGNWRTFKNNALNGVVLAPTDAIRKVGGYNEQIRLYGWDDCDFYDRLSELSLIKTDLVEQEFCSLDHSDDERIACSGDIAKSHDINRLIQGNRVLASLLPKWTDKGKRQFSYNALDANDKRALAAIREFAFELSGIQDNYIYSLDSEYPFSKMLRDISAHIFNENYPQEVQSNSTKLPIVLMITLYEDRAETRRREMIHCLRTNSQLFDRIIILYEPPSSLEPKPPLSIADELTRLSRLSKCEPQLADLEIVTIDERPSYRDFFRLSKSSISDEQSSWFVIANSDIAFDRSIERIQELNTLQDVLVILSRWERCLADSNGQSDDLYLDAEGGEWALIHSIINGSPIPNYLSADAWIYRDVPEDWEDYTYKLGTYFCDSFFANRAFKSGRPLVNPCHSIRCFHHHNETINSSVEKLNDKSKIKFLHSEEKSRFGGEDPVAGVQWSALEFFRHQQRHSKPFRWNPEGGLWLHLGHVVNASSTVLMIEAALKATEMSDKDIFISIQCDQQYKDFLAIVLEFEDYLSDPRLFLDLRVGVMDSSSIATDWPTSLQDNYPLCDQQWERIAPSLLIFALENRVVRYSDRVHAELLKYLTIDSLHATRFLSSKHPELFRQLHYEATYASQLAVSQFSCTTPTWPRFSLILSLFRAKKYLPRLLENYEAIASLGPCELVIIDANRDTTDRSIIETFINRSDYGHTIQYKQLREDPGIYACWMEAIKLAKSQFVSSFNADDRRSAIHPHLLAEYLEVHGDIDACFTPIKPTNKPNFGWYEHGESVSWFDWYEPGRIFEMTDFIANSNGVYCSQNVAHCMPMWRKSLHDELGPIREDKYGTSADWAFWLECIKNGKRLALAAEHPLGLYYINEKSHNRTNDLSGRLENRIIFDYYGIQQSEFIQQ